MKSYPADILTLNWTSLPDNEDDNDTSKMQTMKVG